MNIDTVRRIAEQLVKDNWTKTKIAFFNVPFKAQEDESFIEVHVLPGEGEQISLGQKALNRWVGIIQITIRTPRSIGTKIAFDYAGELIDMFFGLDKDGMVCHTGYVNNLGNQGQWFVLAVTIPFQYDEFLEAIK